MNRRLRSFLASLQTVERLRAAIAWLSGHVGLQELLVFGGLAMLFHGLAMLLGMAAAWAAIGALCIWLGAR